MSNTALGAALTIDNSVLAKIQEAENKITRLEQTTRTSSDKITKSFRSAGDAGIQYFIDKLKLAQTELSKINVPKIDFGQSINFGQVSQQATLLAESVTKASVAINQYYSATQKSNRKTEISADAERKAYIEKYEMYKKMFDQIERNEKRAIRAAENEAKAQEQAAQRAIAAAKRQYAEQAKLYQQQNLQQNTTYQGALSFAESASTINRRTKAIQYLTQARAQLSATDANYTQKLKALNDAIKRMNAENEKAVQGARNLAQQHSNLMNTSDQLARKLALIFSVSQIQGYVNKLIQVRGEFELQNTALASILQNKDQADKLFGQITELAIRSPFTVKELTTYTKSLAAYQVQYEDLYDTTKMLADVASGLGVDMQRLILAFGQVKAANFLRGTETRQFTEAGINMLGELAKYYTELEGRVVSVAEVQERQFKRMISFADVEQVFKRLTSAGGMFYQMQEKQAETLKGMVSNLQDSIDIMFNSIGEANDGTLKNMVSLVKSIVDNWEIFANVLNASAVGFAAYTLKTISASVATKAFSVANLSATASAKGLNAVLAKSILMFKNLVTWIKANPFTLWATGVAFAAYAISDHMKKVQKAREEYDILSRSLQSSKNEIEGIKSKLDSSNSSVLENQNIVSKLKQGTEEYKDAQEKLNKAQAEQQSVLNELKTKYPEIYDGLVRQKDGTVDMTEAQKAYNKELERTMTLNVLMRQGEGFFSDGIFQDFQDLSTSQKEYENQTRNLEASYNAAKIMIETLAKTSEKFYNQSYSDAKKVINSTDDLATKMQKLNKIAKLSDVWFGDASSLRKILRDATESYSDAFRSFSSDSAKASEEVNRLIDNILAIANVPTDDAFKGLEESAKKSAKRTAEEFINTIPTIKDKFIQEFVNKQLNIRLGFTIDFNNSIPKELSAWQKRINEYIEKNNLEIKPIVSDETTSEYFNNLRSDLKKAQTEISKLQQATEQRGESGASNEAQINSYQEEEKAIKQLLSVFGELETKEKKGRDTTSQVFKDRLSFFERANKEYEKLLQNYSKEEARAKVIETMMAEAKQLKVGSIFSLADFDDKGTLNSFNKLRAMYKQLPEELQTEFLKRFSAIEIGLDIEVRQDRVKAIQDQFSNLFGNYELSLELDKLGLDKDLMSDLFDVDVFDLKEVEDKLDELWIKMAEKQKGIKFLDIESAVKSFGKEGEEAYADMQKRITEAEAKELQNRLKQYAEYLKKSISAKAQAGIESQKEIAKIQKTEGLSYETKNALIKQQREETVKIKAKLEWEDFKSSDVYVKLFDDLEYVSDAALKRLKQNLDMIKESMGELEPEQLKSIQEAYNKIEEQITTRNPFAAMRDAMKEVNELQKQGLTEDVLQQNLLMYDAQANSLKSQISDIETIIGLKQNGISLDTQDQSFLDRNAQYLDQSVDTLRQMVTLKKSALSGVNTNIGITNEDLKSYERARISLTKMGTEIDSIRSLAQNAFGSLKSILESVGVESNSTAMVFADMGMSMVDLIAQAVMFGLQLELLTAAATALGVAINTALGPIGWAVMAIQGIAMGLTAIFQVHDNKRQAIIDREQDKIDELQRSYDELTRTIEKGVSLLEYTENAELTQNLQEQIESYKAMIAAEQDKKKVDEDQIKQWENDIIDLTNQIEDTYDDLRENLVGNFKSLSEELGDAIVSAFEEGGDAASKWGEDVNDIIKDILQNLLIQKVLEPQLQTAVEDYFDAIMPKTSSAEEAYAIVEELQKKYDELSSKQTSGLNDYINKMLELSEMKSQIEAAISEWERLNAAAAGEIPEITEDATNHLAQDITNAGDAFQQILENLPDDLKKYFEGESTDTMTGLSKSISSITADQADALAAITESIRYFASDSNLQLRSILATLTAPAPENPFLLELKAQTEQLRTMNSLWSRIVKSENGSIALNVRIK